MATVNLKVVKPPMSEILTQLQRIVPQASSTTDVTLMCEDGFIPAHSFVLRTASAFFRTILQEYSQHAIRSSDISILLPEFKVLVVRKVVQMMYCGFAGMDTEDLESVKEVMRIFMMLDNPAFKFIPEKLDEDYLPLSYSRKRLLPEIIPPVKVEDDSSSDNDYDVFEVVQEVRSEGSDKCDKKTDEDTDRMDDCTDIEVISSPKKQTSSKQAEVVDLTDESDHDVQVVPKVSAAAPAAAKPSESPKDKIEEKNGAKTPAPTPKGPAKRKGAAGKLPADQPATRALRPRGAPKTLRDPSSDEEEYKKPSSSVSSDEDDEDLAPVKRKRFTRTRNTVANQKPILTGPKVMIPKPGPRSATASQGISNARNEAPKRNNNSAVASTSSPKEEKNESDISSDYASSEGDNDDSDYVQKRHERFMQAATKCGKCKTKYDSARDASVCVTEKHKMVRCYYCFKVLQNTEKLFDHYKHNHKKAGKEDHLLCKFCQQSVSFKSVSTHVISNHLFDKSKTAGANAGSSNFAAGRGRPGRPPNFNAVTANKRKPETSEDDSDSSDDTEIMGGGKIVVKTKTATGRKVIRY